MTFALIDCNNFYVSCERLFRPDLKQVPVAVLSNNDGCIIARSQEVKDLGIKMGTPLFKVRELIAQHHIHIFSQQLQSLRQYLDAGDADPGNFFSTGRDLFY